MGCDLTPPYDHSAPVNHAAAQTPLREWPDECIWAQLQYERWLHDRGGGRHAPTDYLANLEVEWDRRGVCSRCHREIGPSVNEQIGALEERVQNAEGKLGRIRQVVAAKPDLILRPEVTKILDEP